MAQDKRYKMKKGYFTISQFHSFTAGHCVKACKIVQMPLKFAEACKFFIIGVHTAAKFIAG